MATKETITTVDTAINSLVSGSRVARKLEACLFLEKSALDVLQRPRLRQQFSNLVVPALMKEILRFLEGRSRQYTVIEHNLQVLALLGEESLTQSHVLVRLHRKLVDGRKSPQASKLLKGLEHTLFRIYEDSAPRLSLTLHKQGFNMQKRKEAVYRLGIFLSFWGSLSFDEKICRELLKDLLHAEDNDLSPQVNAEATYAIGHIEGSPLLKDSKIRLRIVFSLARNLSRMERVKHQRRKVRLRDVTKRAMLKFRDVMQSDLDKLLRFYTDEKKLFSNAENRIDFLIFVQGVIKQALSSRKSKGLSKSSIEKLVKQFERIASKEADKNVNLQLTRCKNLILQLL